MDPPPSGGDDKWKLSNKGRSRSGRPHTMAAAGMLSRSYSASVTTTRARATAPAAAAYASAAAGGTTCSSSSSSSSSSQHHHQQQQSSSSLRLPKKNKCVEAVKEHRARFYIVRRCVSMLVCWRDY